MRALLDTCSFLWMALDDPCLSARAREVLVDPDQELWLSAASAWEIAIKHARGRLPLPTSPSVFVPEVRSRLGIRALSIDEAAALEVDGLPPHHRDPFDRLLIAQARTGGFTVLTPDPLFSAYQVALLW